MHGFFGKQQYAAMAPNMLTIKLSKHRCLECSTCAIFFSSSLTVSIIALLRSRSLSDTLIKAPFMLLLSLVTSCMPFTKSLWNSSSTKRLYETTFGNRWLLTWWNYGDRNALLYSWTYILLPFYQKTYKNHRPNIIIQKFPWTKWKTLSSVIIAIIVLKLCNWAL